MGAPPCQAFFFFRVIVERGVLFHISVPLLTAKAVITAGLIVGSLFGTGLWIGRFTSRCLALFTIAGAFGAHKVVVAECGLCFGIDSIFPVDMAL